MLSYFYYKTLHLNIQYIFNIFKYIVRTKVHAYLAESAKYVNKTVCFRLHVIGLN